MNQHFTKIAEAWTALGKNKLALQQLLLTIFLFALSGKINFHFLPIWEARQGHQINDLILSQLTPRDFSAPIFIVEYGSILIVLISILHLPKRLLYGLQMFAVLFLFRTLTVYLIALEPPAQMIFLKDPMAAFFFHTEEGQFVVKDLFFSGHVSAMFMLFLIAAHKQVKYFLLVGTVAISYMIMTQHVHYSLDVAFAPIAAYMSYRAVIWLHNESRYGLGAEEIG
jgi:hypothetical protein